SPSRLMILSAAPAQAASTFPAGDGFVPHRGLPGHDGHENSSLPEVLNTHRISQISIGVARAKAGRPRSPQARRRRGEFLSTDPERTSLSGSDLGGNLGCECVGGAQPAYAELPYKESGSADG